MAEKTGKHAIGEASLHIFLDQLMWELFESGIHQEAIRFAFAQSPAIKQVTVGHRTPGPAWIPIGFRAHDIQQRRQPAQADRSSIGHHQFVHRPNIASYCTDVFERY